MDNAKPLAELVRGYLESADFQVSEETGGCLVADKLIFNAERDTRLVWVPEGRPSGGYDEGPLWDSISKVRANYPTTARATVVALRREGFSRDLQQTLMQSRVRLLAPIQFFDSRFRVEESPRAASSIADIRKNAQSLARVPQPFTTEFSSPDTAAQDHQDLFRRLRNEMGYNNGPSIRIVVGRAGIGKSYLFTALFDDLYKRFLEAKRSLSKVPRPIPLLPDHLKKTQALRTDHLIESFLHTDIADPMSSKTFKWLLVNGFATWLLDGLDELYAGDANFFDYLLDLVTIPNSKAQVTIWCRDSLLTTSCELSEFQEVCAGDDVLKIYKLDNWGSKSKRQFVWLQKESRLPKANEGDSDDVRAILQFLDRDESTRVMSGLPFYCRILYNQYVANDLASFSDEVELIEHTISAMKDREIKKGLFDSACFEENGLDEWLEQIAADYIEGKYAGFQRDEAEEYGPLVLRDELSADQQQHIIVSLLNFPLFQAGSESGRVAFVHDLVADAVAARHYLKRLGNDAHEVLKRLAHVDVDRPPLLRFMARRIEEAGRIAIVNELRRPSKDRSFAVALTLMMLAKPSRDILRQVNLEERFLIGVQFSDLDLSKCSFRGSDLTYASFDGCDLTGSSFDGANFHHTAFRDCILSDADMRRCRAQSIVIGSKVEDDIERIQGWFHEASGIATSSGRCPTAQQIMHLFSKFVTPLGSARRDRLNVRALTSGKRFEGAASMEDCIRAAVNAGYLLKPDSRKRYPRASGDQYTEIVEFVKERRASDGIGKMLEKLCTRPNCSHEIE